jgi:hypothetical protein
MVVLDIFGLAVGRSLLSKANRLRESPDFGTTYLNADLTKYQQQSLESELETHLAAGESYTIRGNKVVPFRGPGENPRLNAYRSRINRQQPQQQQQQPENQSVRQAQGEGPKTDTRSALQRRAISDQMQTMTVNTTTALGAQLQASNHQQAIANNVGDIINGLRSVITTQTRSDSSVGAVHRNATPLPAKAAGGRPPVPRPQLPKKGYSNQRLKDPKETTPTRRLMLSVLIPVSPRGRLPPLFQLTGPHALELDGPLTTRQRTLERTILTNN